MRKLLLNPTPLFRKLRQLSLLLSLLLTLPQTAWGDDSTIYNFTGTSDISNKTGTATSNVTGVGERTWTINNFTIFNSQSVAQNIIPNKIDNTLGYSISGATSYTADFMLESDFGITGAFVSATISYTTNNMSSGEVQVYANDNRPLTTGQGEGGKTIMDLTKTSVTLSLSNNYDKKYFNNNHISFQFTFKPSSSADSYFHINSITITTTPVTFYGITVKGTSVRSDNVSNVLNDDFSSVSYNATTNTLTLKNVDLTYGDDKNINATSALTINLVGYNEVGEINVNDGNSTVELKFTTNETLPGRLKFTNISGNTSIVCENGLSWDNTNKYIKSSSTNPHIIYGFGSNNNGNIHGYNNEGGMEDLDVSPVVEFKYSTSNTDIKYFKVSSSAKSCYLYPASLDDMNLVTKAYFLFDWGTCTNKDVKVQIKGLKSDLSDDGTYSSEVSLPSDGGLVEIPLYATINSHYFQFYFSSPTSEFSFIPISVGFQKATGYGISVAGTPVTSTNATTGITAGNGKVYYNVTDNILTLNGAEITSSGIESSVGNLTIHLTGDNSISGINVAGIKSTNGGTLTFTADASSTLHITTTGDAASAITDFADVTMGTGAYLQTDTPTKYDTNGKNFCRQVSSANIVKELVITSAPCYPLWIGNTQFTSTSTPTGFSFDATNNILTLTNVTQANPLISGLANLTIALSGDNSIIKSDSSAVIRSINSQAALIIQKAGTGNGSLYLENNGSDPSASPVVKNFASINHTGLNYSSRSGSSINGASTHDAILSSATIYPLWIAASKPVTASTTSGTGWSYDAANNKLSLNSATINGSIISGLGDLTIDIQGTNTISVSDTASVIRSTSAGKLTITKTGNNPSLVLNNTRDSQISYHAPSIKDFASFELAEGLYLSNAKAYGNEEVPAVYEAFTNVSQNGGNSTMGLITPTLLSNGDKGIRNVTISTDEHYPIWVAHHRENVNNGYNVVYTQISPTNKDDFLGDNVPKVSFIPASTGNGNVNTLVLNGAAITDAIISNLANLTIEFSGTNSLCENGKTEGYIHSSNPNAIITFKSVADNSSISLECANDHAVVEGFANVAFDNAVAEYSGSFSYNTTEKRYKNNSGALQSLTIKAPTVTDISSCFQGQNNYGTYYNPTDNYTIPAGMEAYIVTGVSGNQVVLKSLSILPKQTALLLFKGTATSFNSVTTNESADTSGNILMHADATVTTTGKEYILYKDEFVKATETIPSGKCYLQITTNLPARGVLGIGNDGSTAIEGIDVEATEDETWYDLQGRRIQKPTKAGIYIVNGKKVIINNK